WASTILVRPVQAAASKAVSPCSLRTSGDMPACSIARTRSSLPLEAASTKASGFSAWIEAMSPIFGYLTWLMLLDLGGGRKVKRSPLKRSKANTMMNSFHATAAAANVQAVNPGQNPSRLTHERAPKANATMPTATPDQRIPSGVSHGSAGAAGGPGSPANFNLPRWNLGLLLFFGLRSFRTAWARIGQVTAPT